MRTGDGARLRKQKFAELRGRSWYQALLVVVPCAALVLGASQQATGFAIGAPIVVLGLLLGGGYAWADHAARREVVCTFAAARGLTFLDRIDPPSITPLLRAGDERKMTCAMTGTTEGMDVLLAHFTYTDVTHDADGDRQETNHTFTVATTGVEPTMLAMPTLHLRPRGFMDFGSGWLKTGGLAKCETESLAFNERFKAWHREDQDAMVLRRLLDPSNVDRLANHPLKFGVELTAGQLLVYTEGHAGDSGELAALLEILGFLRAALFAAARVPSAA